MGLDNIPHNYPCKKNGTAVLVPVRNKNNEILTDINGEEWLQIDCEQTQESGGCPYVNANPPSGAVSGLFGTSCWYRGKYGNYLIDMLGIYDENDGLSFYGSDENGEYKSSEECLELADVIEKEIAEIVWSENPSEVDYLEQGHSLDIRLKQDCEYAVWWLRWVAEEADGTYCWY